MSDSPPSLSETVLRSTSSAAGTSSSWLPFCVGTATGAVLVGGAMLAWQRVSHRGTAEDGNADDAEEHDFDLNESFMRGDETFNTTNDINNLLFTPTSATHRVPPALEDTLNTMTALTTQHSLVATPSHAVRPDENLMRDAQEQGTTAAQNNQSLLNLLYNIAEDQARKEGYIHRGISCNICNTSPLCGIRYKCASCVDYDICERCEPLDTHNRTHTFLKIRIPIPPLANPRSVLVKPFYSGAEVSTKRLAWDDITRLQGSTYFDQNEVEALYDQYQTLCTKRQGITREVYDRCLGPLGLEKNLVLDRLFKFYDINGDGYIDFEEFINGLSVLVKGSQEEKITYTFEGYDLDGVGAISRDNLRKMFKAYFYITIELVRDVVKACEEEMMANFDDTQGRPVSSLFSAPIPADTGGAPNANGKVPFPGNPGSSREDMWPVMEAMSQDAIEEMVQNVFKMAKIDPSQRITLEQFKELAVIDSSLIAWFDALGTVF